MNEAIGDEFQGREQQIPNQLAATLTGFLDAVVASDWTVKMNYAEYVQELLKVNNIKWACSVGILTMDQALTMLADIPPIALVNLDTLAITEAVIEQEFSVNASRSDSSQLGVKAGSEFNAKTGGLSSLIGGSASVKLTCSTTYNKDTRRESDYSSTVKTKVTMGRIPAPEGVQKLIDATNEFISQGMEINKTIINKQQEKMAEKADSQTAPQSLPENVFESDKVEEGQSEATTSE